MRYCTNCGKAIEFSISFCPNCFLDQNIPEEVMDKKIREYSFLKVRKPENYIIEYPGESTSLALAILISVVIGVAFSLITIGVFILILIIGLIYFELDPKICTVGIGAF